MITYLREPVVHNAFYKKYAGKKFLKGMLCCVFSVRSVLMPSQLLFTLVPGRKSTPDNHQTKSLLPRASTARCPACTLKGIID